MKEIVITMGDAGRANAVRYFEIKSALTLLGHFYYYDLMTDELNDLAEVLKMEEDF